VTVQKEFPQAGCYSNKNLLSTEIQDVDFGSTYFIDSSWAQ